MPNEDRGRKNHSVSREAKKSDAATRPDRPYAIEPSMLDHALYQAKIWVWFWEAETRQSYFRPTSNEAGDPVDDSSGRTDFREDELLQTFHPDDQERVTQVWNRAYENHLPYAIDYRVVEKDGTVLHKHESATPEFDEDGRYLGYVGITRDITEQRQTEALLAETDARFKAFLDSTPDAGSLKDTDGRYILANKAFMEMTGLDISDLDGKTDWEVFPNVADRIPEFEAHDRRVEALRAVIREERSVTTEDGTERYFIVTKFPVFNSNGELTGIGTTNQDITDRKNAEQTLYQAQKMEAIGQLTGGVAHDFNNLLAVIQGNAELLAKEIGSDNRLGRSIIRASMRGAELTQRLLAFARRQPLQPRVVVMADLVGGMTSLLKCSLGEAIEIQTLLCTDLWPALADPGQVENALLNLAVNARDAMRGSGKLTIECQNARVDEDYAARHPEVLAGDYVVLAVSDTGTGMSPEVQAQAFDPFFTTKDVGKGSGLGLSMVYGFAKQSGGHTRIRSVEGHGTTVKLYLPRTDDELAPIEESVGQEVPRGTGERVLALEDDSDVRQVMVQLLEELGYRVIAAADAHEALAALETETVDVVISDVVLPGGLSGPEFAEIARERRPGLGVIFMSGYSDEAVRQRGILGHNQVFLNKPFNMEQLAKTLYEALQRMGE